jgi:hypothetical protein
MLLVAARIHIGMKLHDILRVPITQRSAWVATSTVLPLVALRTIFVFGGLAITEPDPESLVMAATPKSCRSA